ncbi:MAG: hypothetical protein QOE82_1872, partial [Thermoanaerobaculia bacterium]|nr:hypothetical protein [Thermoanaerobaculia bacterium]
MTTGGRTNIYGVLFQIFGTVEWAFRIASRLVGEGDEEEIRIIAEPEGGDLDVRWPYARVVQQMKTRRTGKPWRLREVIDGVIPDLYLSVERARAGESRYELVLDSPQSVWPDFDAFAKYLASNPVPARPSEGLDDTVRVAFFPTESLTQRELFVLVRDTVRKREELKDEPVEETEKNLWHLLANFHVIVTPSGTAQLDALRPLLARYGYAGTEAEEKIDALAGAVLRRSTGEIIPFSPVELLAETGITGVPITKLSNVRNAARLILGRDLRRRTSYSAATDVRRGMRASPEGRIAAFIGESGGGKSWELARRAERASTEGIVVFRIASDDPERDVRNAIETVARDILGWKVDRTTDDLIAALRARFGTVPDPWLAVYLDNVGIAEVNTLLTLPLAEWGVRVVLTAPRAYAEALRERITCVEVENFTTTEVRDFLRIHDCDPDSVPPDIRETLKLPLLAWIYTAVARTDREFRPQNEYPIYERYWMRLRTAGVQAKYPADETRVTALARDFREDGAYPWPTSVLDAAGVDDGVRQRLESIGWLTRDEHGRASIWHDRLLNWAVAESVAGDLRDHRLAISEAAKLLGKFAKVPLTRSERPLLRYVPMDVVWILARRKWLTDQKLSEMIEALEAPDVIGHHVYELLTTVGTVMVPAIVLRAKRIGLGSRWLSGSIVDALTEIDDGASADFGEIVNGFLSDPSLIQQTIGFLLAIRRPAGPYLTRLWQLHMEISARFRAMSFPHSGDDPQIELDWNAHWTALERGFDALRHCVRKAPEWLEQHATLLAEEDAGAAASLIAAVGDPLARGIWKRTKQNLKDHAALDDTPQLLDCIRLFRDADERPFIDEALRSSEKLTQASPLAALVHLDADAAVEILSSLDAYELEFARKWWVPWLAMLRPEELSRKLAERIRNVPADALSIAEMFDSFEELLSAPVGEALLDWIDAYFEETSHVENAARLLLADSAMEVLAASPDPELRAAIRARAGSRLESHLVTICSDHGDDHYALRETDAAANLLRRIEGAGFCDFVQNTISPDASNSRAEFARFCPDIKMVEKLKERIARTYNDKQTLGLAVQSMRLLAAVGGRVAITEMARMYGDRIIEISVPSLIENDAALDDAQMEPVLAELKSTDENVRVKALTALSLSGREDYLDTVIAVARGTALASPVRNMALIALRHLLARGDS